MLELHTAASVEPMPTRWLSRGRVPLGGLTVIAGRQGEGKSTWACHLAAATTNGLTSGNLAGQPSEVVMVTAEDNWSSTLRPRMEAAEANLHRVHFVKAGNEVGEILQLPDDAPELASLLRPLHPALIVLDPLVALLAGNVDSYRDQDMRRALSPLHQLAAELDCAVIAIWHLNKGTGTDWMTRVAGSSGLTAAARSVLLFGPDPDYPSSPRRALAHVKCNVGTLAPGRSYRIEEAKIGEQEIETSKIIPFGPSTATAASILSQYNSGE